MDSMLKKVLYSTNNQKVLYFLLEHIGEEYYDRQISKLAGVSRAGANFALRELVKAGLVKREKRGRMSFYRLEQKSTFIKYLKLIQNIVLLQSLIDKLIPLSLRLILYGSAGKGENRADSDFDIFVLARDTKEVKRTIFESDLRKRIQHVVCTPNEFAKLRKKNAVFYKEILDGIVLWEEKKRACPCLL